ncbi:unnamed protein product, partial [Urochloa humidicola]
GGSSGRGEAPASPRGLLTFSSSPLFLSLSLSLSLISQARYRRQKAPAPAPISLPRRPPELDRLDRRQQLLSASSSSVSFFSLFLISPGQNRRPEAPAPTPRREGPTPAGPIRRSAGFRPPHSGGGVRGVVVAAAAAIEPSSVRGSAIGNWALCAQARPADKAEDPSSARPTGGEARRLVPARAHSAMETWYGPVTVMLLPWQRHKLAAVVS